MHSNEYTQGNEHLAWHMACTTFARKPLCYASVCSV